MGTEGISKLQDIEVIGKYLETKDSQYFSLLYKRYSSKVYGKCISLLKEEYLAKDATQEIFLKIFLNLGRFGSQAKFSTWVYSITYNHCIDIIRKDTKNRNIFSDDMEKLPEVEEDVLDEAVLTMEVDRLREVLDKIPVDDKVVLLMKYQDDMQIKEIADVLNKSESAIKMKLKRAKFKAQNVYNKLYPEP
jgi:RNA polymerase sigma-70 factor (ECF subfamily)